MVRLLIDIVGYDDASWGTLERLRKGIPPGSVRDIKSDGVSFGNAVESSGVLIHDRYAILELDGVAATHPRVLELMSSVDVEILLPSGRAKHFRIIRVRYRIDPALLTTAERNKLTGSNLAQRTQKATATRLAEVMEDRTPTVQEAKDWLTAKGYDSTLFQKIRDVRTA